MMHFGPSRWIVGVVAVGMAASWSHHGYAKAPEHRYMIANGTVLDTKTGLTWQQGHQGNTLNWNDAKSYCSGLPLEGGGWRLPTVKELQSIVDEKITNPSIDEPAFPNTPSEWFWTSSPWAGSVSAAWVVYFGYGYTNYGDVTDTYRVRCVR